MCLLQNLLQLSLVGAELRITNTDVLGATRVSHFTNCTALTRKGLFYVSELGTLRNAAWTSA